MPQSSTNDGAMQPFALTLDKFLAHAAKWKPNSEVVTAGEDGRIERIDYAHLMFRSQKISTVLSHMGVGLGDKVATLAWNTQAHVEVWDGMSHHPQRERPSELAAFVERHAVARRRARLALAA